MALCLSVPQPQPASTSFDSRGPGPSETAPAGCTFSDCDGDRLRPASDCDFARFSAGFATTGAFGASALAAGLVWAGFASVAGFAGSGNLPSTSLGTTTSGGFESTSVALTSSTT